MLGEESGKIENGGDCGTVNDSRVESITGTDPEPHPAGYKKAPLMRGSLEQPIRYDVYYYGMITCCWCTAIF